AARLLAYTDEAGDLEESTVRQLLSRETPPGQPPGLCLVQLVQRGPVAVDRLDREVKGADESRLGCVLDEDLVQLVPVGRSGRQEGADEVIAIFMIEKGEEVAQGPGIQRELVTGRIEPELMAGFVEHHRQIALPQGGAIGLPQDGNEDLLGFPGDIERSGVAALGAPTEHVLPPPVLQRDAHVVRHEVGDQPEVVADQGVAHGLNARFAAQLILETVVVDDVVAVRGSGRRREDRRGVEMADSERPQVGGEVLRLLEAGALPELQAIGRDQRLAHETSGLSSPPARVIRGKRTSAATSSTVTSERMRQLGYSSMITGRFGCRAERTASSSCTDRRREPSRARAWPHPRSPAARSARRCSGSGCRGSSPTRPGRRAYPPLRQRASGPAGTPPSRPAPS